MLPLLVDPAGRTVLLGSKLGQGGEAAVYAFQQDHGRVAKVFPQPLPATSVAKLRATIAARSPALAAVCAWPEQLLGDGHGATWGFSMPRIDKFLELHLLYSPGDRRRRFGQFGYDFLVQAARNLAAAVGRVHEHGHVVGDLNQRNILVDQAALVRLIDCDSMQIASAGRTWRCPVGTPHLTAPELHGQDFDQVDRSPQHDGFALAVLLFHLLLMGRHPFAGVWSGSCDMSIERAIREGRYAYAAEPLERDGVLRPPPLVPPVAIVGPALVQLFERAFELPGPGRSRPDAAAWVQALDRLRGALRPCVYESHHLFYNGLPRCPWCTLEEQGAWYFAASRKRSTTLFDAAALRHALAQVPVPRFATLEAPPPEVVEIDPRLEDLRVLQLELGVVGGIGALLLLALLGSSWWLAALPLAAGLAWWGRRLVRRYASLRAQRKLALEQAEAQLQQAVEGGRPALFRERFEARRAAWLAREQEVEQLRAEAQAQLAQLRARNRELQLDEFLRGFLLKDAALPQLDVDHRLRLAAHGIESAADLELARVVAIAGFGLASTLVQELLGWRQGLELKFRFDPGHGPPRAEIDRVQARWQRRRDALVAELQGGPAELRAYGHELLREQQKAHAAIHAAAALRNQALAAVRA